MAQSYYPSRSRSSTAEPPEAEERECEIKCHQALLDDGSRPLFHVGLLPQIEANPDAYSELLRPWARQQHPADVREDWQALSRQWNRWKEFRAWQLRGRRRRLGLAEYLDTERREFAMHGGIPTDPEFAEAARRLWEREYDYGGDDEDVEGAIERHAERVRELLAGQGFAIRPFHLLADPKKQDQWTTYVEYLAFETSSLHGLAAAARRRQKRARMRALAGGYEVAKAKAEQQQCTVDWVRSEIDKIEAEQKTAAGKSGGSTTGSKSGNSRKRRPAEDNHDDPEDPVAPRLGKRRRTEEVDNTEKTDETKMPADKGDNSSQTR